MTPALESPWPKPSRSDCYFYHTMIYPDGEMIDGTWTIHDFSDYVGGYDMRGKTVLDIGTASGYLAFNAEQQGAQVTALEAASTHEFRHMPFAASMSYRNIEASRRHWTKTNLVPIKNSWWYSWHKFGSRAECVYAPIPELYEWERRFDVVLAGAIIEHLSDPVYAIGAWTKVAREAVIIPFTDVIEDESLFMRPLTPLTDPSFFYVWWQLSAGLYRRVFDNVGFDVSFTLSHARHNDAPGGPTEARRPTIIARRR